MTFEELCTALAATPEQMQGAEAIVSTGYTGDLLSDVMAHAQAGSVLITVQAHLNTIAVATLVGASGIMLCNGRTAPADMRAIAAQKKIPIATTSHTAYTISYRVATLLTHAP